MTKSALELPEAAYRSALDCIRRTGFPPDASAAPVKVKAKRADSMTDAQFHAALATITMTGRVPVEQGATK